MRERLANALTLDQYEILVGSTMLILGLVQLVTGQHAYSVAVALNPFEAVLWSCILVFGGLACVWGHLRPSLPLRVLGLRILAVAGIVYAACIIIAAVSLGSSWVAVSLTAALWVSVSVGHIMRSWSLAKNFGGGNASDR